MRNLYKQIQRLKGVHQGGASHLVNPKWNVTRYEHSIGTMLLVRMMGGSIEEQIAGLLHDISHTAFSHVVDFALKHSDEDYHEIIYDEIVENSHIPKILSKYGYDYKDILFNEAKWTILEKSAPKLCADRVDYTLRDMFHYGFISHEEVQDFLKNLTIVDNQMVITSIKSCEWFVDTYYKEVIGFFLLPLNIFANNRLAKALEISLNLNEITLDDLLKEDKDVYALLEKSDSNEVLSLINSLNGNVNLIEDKENYDIFQKNKLRIIDPTVVIDGKLFKSSEKSQSVNTLTQNAYDKSMEGVYIKII